MADKKAIPFALLEALKTHTDKDHILSTKKLMALLESDYDLTIERRTLYANIDMLKDFGYRISTWQENGYGYYLEEHQFSKSEVFLLCNAIHSSHFISDRESSRLIDKLLSTLSVYEKQEYTDRVFLPNKKKTEKSAFFDNLYAISDAIRDRHPITFLYLQYNALKKLEPRRPERYEIEPRYIVYQDSRPYLIATSDHHEGFANYRIDRISDLDIIKDKKFSALRKDLDAYEYSRNMYYMFNDAQSAAVIRCKQRILDHVIDTFGTDCMIVPVDNDYFDVHIKGSETGILLFSQQYLDAAEIIEPEELRNEMSLRLKQSVKSYRR